MYGVRAIGPWLNKCAASRAWPSYFKSKILNITCSFGYSKKWSSRTSTVKVIKGSRSRKSSVPRTDSKSVPLFAVLSAMVSSDTYSSVKFMLAWPVRVTVIVAIAS